MTNYILAYVTAKNKDEAAAIGRALVEERLAACVNIIDNMTSIYRWNGEICDDDEAILIAKTSAGKFRDLSDRVTQLHSYECPCVISIPVIDGNGAYLKWIGDNIL